MADFKHLKDLAVDDTSTAKFRFTKIMGVPTLTVRPAHRVNKDFLNEMLAAPKKIARAAANRKSGDEDLAEHLSAVREGDVEVFARCIVVDWVNVFDSSDEQVEFSEENCMQFLRAVPEDMFDDLRSFCLNIDNFRRGRTRITSEEEEALSGN